MTTKHSPLRVLKTQADQIAKVVKAVERGESPMEDKGGKIAAARNKPTVTFGITMDDKLLKIEMAWAKIKETGEVALAAYVLKQMREQRETAH